MDQQEIETSGLSRRHFIQGASSVALAAGIFSSSSLNALAASTPGKKGGTLKVGVVGGANDLFDPNYTVAKADEARLHSTFETLLTFDENFKWTTANGLAESAKANGASQYTIKLLRAY